MSSRLLSKRDSVAALVYLALKRLMDREMDRYVRDYLYLKVRRWRCGKYGRIRNFMTNTIKTVKDVNGLKINHSNTKLTEELTSFSKCRATHCIYAVYRIM